MAFQLRQKSQGKLLTTFHILNSAGDAVGSANIPNGEVSQFLRCWQLPTTVQPRASAAVNRNTDPMIAALLRNKTPMSRAAVLRGCYYIMSTGNGSLDIAATFSDSSNRQLGILLAIAEKGPAFVAQVVSQLNASGPLGQEVAHWYNEAKASLATVP